ncbi:MAG: flagellar basal body-associated FliL family protein [Verrucomicrobia bacterium]|nr:flagellar basal body-associated FliL family protein [Verrucomicrobiota bacterium]
MADPEPNDPSIPGAPKTPSVWAPVIAVILLVPAVTYGMAEFLIIPKLRSAVLQPKTAAEQSKKDAPAKGEKGKSEHGKGEEAGDRFTYDFESVVVNLSGALGTRYLKTTFTLYSENADLKKIVDQNKKQLVDVAITILGSRTLAELDQPGSKNVVRSDLIANFNQAMKSNLVEQIYFSEFVIQ